MYKKSKRCAPIIVFLDIVIVLLFVYIILPRQTGFNLEPIYEKGLANGTVVIEYLNNSANPLSIWSVKNNIIENKEKNKTKYSGYVCKNKCLNILKSDLKININSDSNYAIYIPQKVMTEAYSMWDSFCTGKNEYIDCNNEIRINASTGEVYLCSKDRKKYFHSEKENKLVTFGEECK